MRKQSKQKKILGKLNLRKQFDMSYTLKHNIPIHSSKAFVYSSDNNMFIIDSSSFKQHRIDDYIFEETNDVGFYIESTKTYNKILFKGGIPYFDIVNGVLYWEYYSYEETVINPLKVRIYNK